jgi:hypothetical protein
MLELILGSAIDGDKPLCVLCCDGKGNTNIDQSIQQGIIGKQWINTSSLVSTFSIYMFTFALPLSSSSPSPLRLFLPAQACSTSTRYAMKMLATPDPYGAHSHCQHKMRAPTSSLLACLSFSLACLPLLLREKDACRGI